VSILEMILGDENTVPRHEFWYYYTGELRAVRDRQWKRVFEHRTRSYVGVEPGADGHPGPYAFPTVPAALYDLSADIGETRDVSIQHPDVVARMEVIAEKARVALGDRLTQRQGSDVRPPGRYSLKRANVVEHAAVGAHLMSVTPSDPRYPGARTDALIDGRLGSGDFRDGRWLAYDGVDFEATIDTGTVRNISRVGLDCLQIQSAWVLLPRRVTFSVSSDLVQWIELPSIECPAEPDPEVNAHLLTVDVDGSAVRYIRVKAENHEPLPDWHPGSGNTGWIFIDEIVVLD